MSQTLDVVIPLSDGVGMFRVPLTIEESPLSSEKIHYLQLRVRIILRKTIAEKAMVAMALMLATVKKGGMVIFIPLERIMNCSK